MKKIILVLAAICLVAIGCKKEIKEDTKKEAPTLVAAENLKETSFKISGMTCEVGCAKTIAAKLCKKEGVIAANIVFSDSIATVKFDASKTNDKALRTFVEGIGGDKMYKTCDTDCKKTKKECSKKETEAKKVACSNDCKKECCVKNMTACKTDCKKECCKTA